MSTYDDWKLRSDRDDIAPCDEECCSERRCSECDGIGSIHDPDDGGSWHRCRDCDGTGEALHDDDGPEYGDAERGIIE